MSRSPEREGARGARPLALLVFALLLAATLFAYRLYLLPTPIGRILADPRTYDEKLVLVEGSVARSLGVLGYGAYELEDDSGKITVVTDAGLPPTGARVRVRGLAKQAFTLGERTLVVVVEKRRR